MCVRSRIITIAKYINFSNDGTRKMELKSCDGQDDGEDIHVSFIGISRIFPTCIVFFFKMELCDRVYRHISGLSYITCTKQKKAIFPSRYQSY